LLRTKPQTQKDIPVQLLVSTKPLKASIVIGSFGSANGYNSFVFEVEIKTDPNAPAPHYEKPLRYGKKEEIHHIFRADPKSPPKVISLFFSLAVAATVPVLFIGVSTLPHLVATGLTIASTVAGPRSEPQPLYQRDWRGSFVACLLLWLHYRHRVCLLHVLHEVEPLPDSTCRWHCRRCCHSEWYQGFG